MSDDLARNEIISKVTGNFFVEAGAGSGKTTILVERMVAMVEQGFPVDRICTITFTKAAANEFYARFQKRLSERSRDEHKASRHAGQLGEQTAETKANCQRALLNIDSCFMGTIDSFCNMILSEHPLEAGIPANSTVVEEADIVERYLQEFSQIMINDDYADLRNRYELFINTQVNPVAVFRALLSTVIQIRDAEFVFDRPDGTTIETKYRQDKKDIVRLLRKLLEDPEVGYMSNQESAKCWDALLQRRDALTEYNWDRYFTYVLNSLKSIRKLRVKPFDGIEDYFGPAFARLQPHMTRNKLTWYELADEGFQNIVDDMIDYQARIALDFTVECMNRMAEVLRKQGNLTFFDYKLYLRNMLREDASGDHKLTEHIYNRHSYFLIDEFQDTDPMQAEIFFYLAAQKHDPDWRKCVPHPGSLFIVGDPKQSIYRFKNADVASFKNVRSLFNGDNGEVVRLTSNFRSTYSLHQWFNHVFGDCLLADDTEDQSRYEPISNKDSDDGFETGVYGYQPADADDDSSEVMDIISTLVNNPKVIIGENRTVSYRDIMIITSAKKQLSRYVNAFTAAHIPFRVEGDIDFNECPALRDLVAVYKAVACPDNNLYIYEALTSRVFAMDDETAMAIRDDIRRVKTSGVFTSENEKADRFIDLLNRYSSSGRKLTPSALMARLADELRIFAVSGNHDMEYVYYVLELLRESEATGEISSVQEAVVYLEELMSNERKLERCASLEKNDNRIHLANLHKVKGLEAPVVILAGTRKRGGNNRADKRVEYVGDVPRCYMFEVNKDSVYLAYRDKYDKKEKEKGSQEAERIRQLYVAATRAGRILIIGEANPWKDLAQFAEKDFFSCFEKAERKPFVPETVDGARLYDEASGIITDDSVSRTSGIHIRKPSDIEYDSVVSEPSAVNTKRNPKLIGTLVHRLMEVLVSSRNAVDADEIIADMCNRLDEEDDYYSVILRKVNDRIQNGGCTQSNGSEPDILSELLKADEVYCEVPFSYRNGPGMITTGIIDVLYRKGSEWFIVDYKTNAEGEGLDEEYESQLNEYRKAFRDQTGLDCCVRIYHIDTL